MHAYLGVLYMAGVMKSQYVNTTDLWSTDGTAPDYFSSVMSQRRFHLLMRDLRFNDGTTRKENAKYDNLAPIRKMFEDFNKRCSDNYSVGAYVTIDEILEANTSPFNTPCINPTLSLTFRRKIAAVTDNTPDMIAASSQDDHPKIRCRYCPIRKNRFTTQRCGTCVFPICKEHTMTTISTCISCAAHGEDSED
ncbi:Transposase IS4 [Popillia japonica]|uniref:Transposase IS4 n=1 Tax=Popillia japonica TaxID=7064 RepID=A0AAW1K0B2_POPJA